MADLSYYLSLDYKSEVTPDCYEDGTTYFVARIPDWPGCVSSGSTREEAEENLRDAKRLYLATALEHGFTPARPAVAPVATVAWPGSRGENVVGARLGYRRHGRADAVRKGPSSASISVGRRQSVRAKAAG